MSESASAPVKASRAGCPPGAGIVQLEHGGQIGNPPFEPTAEQRLKVRALAKVFPPVSNKYIAIQIIGPHGPICQRTLERHFRDDMAIGRAELLTAVGTQLLKRALEGPNAEGVKGDPYVQMQIMARLAGWTGKTEIMGPGGGPIQTVDLSRFSAANLMEYGRLSAIAEGIDPDSILIEHVPEPDL